MNKVLVRDFLGGTCTPTITSPSADLTLEKAEKISEEAKRKLEVSITKAILGDGTGEEVKTDMAEYEFKVGDTVRVIYNSNNPEHCFVIGSIAEVIGRLSWSVEVKGESYISGETIAQLVNPCDLQLISSADELMCSACPTEPIERSPLAEKLLDRDTKALIKAGVLTRDLRVRDVEFVLAYIVETDLPALAKLAREKLKAEKKSE